MLRIEKIQFISFLERGSAVELLPYGCCIFKKKKNVNAKTCANERIIREQNHNMGIFLNVKMKKKRERNIAGDHKWIFRIFFCEHLVKSREKEN